MNEPNHVSAEALSAYFDDECAERERASIAAHLAACESCRVRLEQLQQLARSLRDQAIPPAPAGLRTRISQALGPRRLVPRWAYAAAAAVAGVALLLVLLERRPPLVSEVEVSDTAVTQPAAKYQSAPAERTQPSAKQAPAPAPESAPKPPPPQEAEVSDQSAAARSRDHANAIEVIEQTAPEEFREADGDDEVADTAASPAPLTAQSKLEAQAEKRRDEPCVTLPTTFLVPRSAGSTGFSRWFENRTGFAPQVETGSAADGYTFQVPRVVWERYKGEPLTGLDPGVQCVRFRVQVTK